MTGKQVVRRLTTMGVITVTFLTAYPVFIYFGGQQRQAKYSEVGDLDGVLVLAIYGLFVLAVIGCALACDVVKRRRLRLVEDFLD